MMECLVLVMFDRRLQNLMTSMSLHLGKYIFCSPSFTIFKAILDSWYIPLRVLVFLPANIIEF